jgi:hypothetical protein
MHLVKIFFIFQSKFFMLVSYTILDKMFEFRTFYEFLVYILNFLCSLEFFSKK